MKPHIAALQKTLLTIVRRAGSNGISPADAKTLAREEHPDAQPATVDYAFTGLVRAAAIHGRGPARQRLYVATVSNSEEDAAAARQARADIYAPRPLTSWPPKFRPRPDPDWMHQERKQ